MTVACFVRRQEAVFLSACIALLLKYAFLLCLEQRPARWFIRH